MEGQVKTSSWVFDEAGSYYLNNEGHPITSSWKEINGSTYYFDAEGHRVNGNRSSMVMNTHSRNLEYC